MAVDFDFFTNSSLDRDALRASLPFVGRALVLQDELNAWTMLAPSADDAGTEVTVSFFGGIDFGRVGEPERTADGVLAVASLADLLASTEQ